MRIEIIKFFELPKKEKVIIALSFITFFIAWILFKILSLKKLISFIQLLSFHFLSEKKKFFSLERIFYLHSKSIDKFFKPSCLVKCISVKLLFSLYGFRSSIQSGIFFKEGKLKGHAWINAEGKDFLSENENIAKYTKSFTF